MTALYPFPPLTPTDPAVVAAELARVLGDAWDRLEAEYNLVLNSVDLGRNQLVLDQLDEFKKAVAAFQARVDEQARIFVSRDLPAMYAAAAETAVPGEPFTWTQTHVDAVTSLASDSYGDFLRRSQDAGRTSDAFARAVREVARRTVPQQDTGRFTAKQAARQMRETLEREHGISAAVYADGSLHTMREYTLMAALTKGAVAQSYATLNRLSEAKVRFVEVFDGPSCGWTSHDDPDTANGSIRHVEEAFAYPISHPRCVRAFGGRPDVKTKQEAKTAKSSIPPETRADSVEQERMRQSLRQGTGQRPAQRARATKAETRARRTPDLSGLMPHPDDTPMQLAMRRAATVRGSYLDPETVEPLARATYELEHPTARGAMSSQVRAVHGDSEVSLVTGDVLHEGDQVGEFTRVFTRLPDGAVSVEHESLRLLPDWQRLGFATAFNAQAEAFYRTHGVARITLTASGGGTDVGGYVWAVAGYDWRNALSLIEVAETLERWAVRMPAIADQARALANRLRDGDLTSLPTPFEISQLGRELAAAGESWPGRDIMGNTTWDGVRWLR